MATVSLGHRSVGDDEPCFIIAEIGINHNGDVEIAKRLISAAVVAGCDAVKFQKRTPELCVPPDQRALMRDTPWGVMSYLEYRAHIEFGHADTPRSTRCCRAHGIAWFASCWDEPSVDFIEQFIAVCYKVPSACLTDDDLLGYVRRPVGRSILSTGMSTMEEVRHAVSPTRRIAPPDRAAHEQLSVPAGGAEPAHDSDASGRVQLPSRLLGHETGLHTTCAAVHSAPLRRTPHHARPRDVGHRPGRLRRVAGA